MLRALVADDDEQMLQMYERILEQSGLQVFTAPDAESGLSLFREKDPDFFHLVVSDMNMNHLTGVGFFNILRNDLGYRGAFFLISGSCPEGPNDVFESDPLAVFLGKPVNMKRLRLELARISRGNPSSEIKPFQSSRQCIP